MASASMGLVAGLFGYLLLGAIFPLRTSRRRFAFHLRNSSALATFLILGPWALALVLPAAVLAALAPFRVIHLDSDTSIGRVVVRRVEDYRAAARAVLVDTAFLTGAILLTHAYYGILLAKSYPVPLDRVTDLLIYFTVAFTESTLVAVFSEIYFRLVAPPVAGPSTTTGNEKLLPDDAPLYGLLLTIGSPLQLLAHVLFLYYGTVPLLLGMTCFVIFVLLHSLLLQRRARFTALLKELEANERLAALGELTGRIVHQTRHQAGLIGITVHMVRDALDHRDPPKEKIRKELDRLESVAENLRQMLAGDLVERERPLDEELDNPTTLLGLVDREVDCLQAKARRRGVTVVVHGGEDADLECEPRELKRLSEGIFNVLENAITAARSTVILRIERETPDLLLTIADDGDGIESSFLSHACEPFTSTKQEGTGMGLAIALSAARVSGGDLTLQNRPEGGLQVTFRLRPAASTEPLSAAATQPDGSAPHESAKPAI